jgi:hypothetical protein
VVVSGISWAVTAVGITGVTAAYLVAGLTLAVGAGAAALVSWGVGTLLSAAGSALGPNGSGVALSATVNPLAPWNVCYGRCRVGGATIYEASFGDNDKYLDLVIVLACHPCESIDWLMLDNRKVQIGDVQTTTNGWAGVSFTPVQQTIAITNASDISRTQNVVTIALSVDIPLLAVGDQVKVTGVHPVNLLLNGTFPVSSLMRDLSSSRPLTISYLAGGMDFSSGSITETGQVETVWADYGRKVYMEVMLGGQMLGETFQAAISGTPYDGDWDDMQTASSGQWTSDCSLLGKTAVFLRLHYSETIFPNGLPQISFTLHGKRDILDPRTSPETSAYSENPALCIADYLADKTWGYGATYGTEIPVAELIAAANICDEAVALATPATSPATTEPRYTCNGTFSLTLKRVEVLQNLLTSCAGRLGYVGGQFRLYPGAWRGISGTISGTELYSMLRGAFQWRGSASVTNLFNGVKGTYISPFNNWQPADFPRYAQDTYHGYDSDANLMADGGDRRWLDVQLPFTVSCATAQRIAKIELLRRRHQGTGTFPLSMAAYPYIPMDVIEVDLPFFGWTGKNLDVLESRLKMSDGSDDSGTRVPTLSVEIEVQETDESIYAWSVGEELSPEGYQQAIVPDNRTPAAPTDVLLSSLHSSVFVTWAAPADAYVLNGGHVEVEYQLVASPEGLWASAAKMDPTVMRAEIPSLVIGSYYNVRVRSVNAAGVPSAWVIGCLPTSPPTEGPVLVGPPPPWEPQFEAPITGDALFSAKGFGIAQSYSLSESGAMLPGLSIYGARPAIPYRLQAQVRRELVSGVFAQQAANVTTVDSTHGTIAFGGSGGTAGVFVGRVLSKLANAIGSEATVGIADFTVTANDAAGNFTVTPNPVTAGCSAGDLFTLRTAPTAADAMSFTDSGFNNQYNAGLTVSGNAGNTVLVIAGHGAGQTPQVVTDNTGTKVSVSPGWDIIPNSTSVIVLVEATPQVVLPVATAGDGATNSLIASVPIPNYARQVVRAEVYTVDLVGNLGGQEVVASREMYIWGAQGTRYISASTTQLTTDKWFVCTVASTITIQLLSSDQWVNGEVGVENDKGSTANVTVQFATNETDNTDSGSVTIAPGEVWSGRAHE